MLCVLFICCFSVFISICLGYTVNVKKRAGEMFYFYCMEFTHDNMRVNELLLSNALTLWTTINPRIYWFCASTIWFSWDITFQHQLSIQLHNVSVCVQLALAQPILFLPFIFSTAAKEFLFCFCGDFGTSLFFTVLLIFRVQPMHTTTALNEHKKWNKTSRRRKK